MRIKRSNAKIQKNLKKTKLKYINDGFLLDLPLGLTSYKVYKAYSMPVKFV